MAHREERHDVAAAYFYTEAQGDVTLRSYTDISRLSDKSVGVHPLGVPKVLRVTDFVDVSLGSLRAGRNLAVG